MRYAIGYLSACDRYSESTNVVDELTESVLCLLRLLLVGSVDFDCDRIYIHNAVSYLIDH